MNKYFNQLHVKLVFISYLYALIGFSIFRLFLFFIEIDKLSAGGEAPDTITIIQAFLMGVRFDLAITGYLMFLPFLILTVLEFLNRPSTKLKKLVFFLIYIPFVLSFVVCASDIPFFGQFYSRFNMAAFQWIDSPGFVLRMIILEPRYWLSIIPFIILAILFFKLLKKSFYKADKTNSREIHWGVKTLSFLLVILLIFTGMRGRLEAKSPIRIGTAYFSDNSFLNQLGLNPNFTLIRSYLSSKQDKAKKIQIMDNKIALSNVQNYFNIDSIIPANPIARHKNINILPKNKYNVVLILMESMSAAKMTRYGNDDELTPFLDSLAKTNYSFDNIYSSGIHTYNGIYSSLFSFPAIYLQHPMIDASMLRYNGISNVLRKHNYTNIYFTTHDGQFDNVEGFLTNNDFDKIITQADYPEDRAKSGLGVPDDYMFEFSIPVLNKSAKENNPFLAVFMTSSDHGPYYIPDYFTAKHSQDKKAIVEYADWSLKKFVESAQNYDWYDSTIFVFIADHGVPINPVYDTPLNYYHTPLIIHIPWLEKPTTYNCIGGQIDVFPTIMGILNLPYTNNTLGIDLRQEERPFIYFNGDDKYGVLDQNHLFISSQNGQEGFYKYKAKPTLDTFQISFIPNLSEIFFMLDTTNIFPIEKQSKKDGQYIYSDEIDIFYSSTNADRKISKDRNNYINEYKEKAESMRIYAKSNLQAAQYLMNKNWQYYTSK